MNGTEILQLRNRLDLTQPQFAQLMGVHPMTVSRWERNELSPTPHQIAFMTAYKKGAEDKKVREEFGAVLIGAGIVAAVLLLLTAATKGE